jgi:hypothetical protein
MPLLFLRNRGSNGGTPGPTLTLGRLSLHRRIVVLEFGSAASPRAWALVRRVPWLEPMAAWQRYEVSAHDFGYFPVLVATYVGVTLPPF